MTEQASPAADIFADNDVTNRVLNVIKNANVRIALVSPYIDRVGHVEQELIKAIGRDVEILVVVRRDGNKIGGNNSDQALAWFKENKIDVQAVPNLHAKFYMNESEGVITSMNLLRSSWSGSLEIGVPATGAQYSQLVGYLRDHLKEFFTEVETAKPKAPAKKPRKKVQGNRSPSKASRARKPKKQESGGFGSLIKGLLLGPPGYCIRCGDPLSQSDVDRGNTMCAKDYASWARYKNPDFEENYCTNCGDEYSTTFARPQCEDCYYG